MPLHKASFLIWIAVVGVHVLLTSGGSRTPCTPWASANGWSRPARSGDGSRYRAWFAGGLALAIVVSAHFAV
jgi:hypothetical protein